MPSERGGLIAVSGRGSAAALEDAAGRAPWRGSVTHQVVTPSGAIAATGAAEVHDDGRWVTALHGSISRRPRMTEHLQPTDDSDAALAAAALTGADFRPHLLKGAFRVVCLDRATGELRSLRSVGGARGLAWARGPSGVAVATEPVQAAAAAGLGPSPDHEVAERYVEGRLRREDAFETGADWLLPGSAARVTDRGLTVSLLDVSTTVEERRPEAAVAHIAHHIDVAVHRSVPPLGTTVASLVTGGLDSASIVAFAARRRAVDLAFTTRVRTLPDSAAETERATATAAQLVGRHEIVDLTVADLFDGMVDFLPVTGPPAVLVFGLMAAAYRRAANSGAEVVLDGIGGDHLFSFDPLVDAVAEHGWRRLAGVTGRNPRRAARMAHRAALLNLNQRYRHPVSLGQRQREWGLHVDAAIRDRLAAHLDIRLECPYLDEGLWRAVAAAPHELHGPDRRLQRAAVGTVLPQAEQALKASYREAQQQHFGLGPDEADRRAAEFFVEAWLKADRSD